MKHFSSDRMGELYDAAIGAGLAMKQDKLLSRLNPHFVAGLPKASFGPPGDQLHCTLQHLNEVEYLTDGSVPMEQWLRAALQFAPTILVFEQALNELEQKGVALEDSMRKSAFGPSGEPIPLGEHLATSFEIASQPLFGWPKMLPGPSGEWIERPELAKLLAALTRSDGKALIVLGGPGSGKSALLSQLACTLRDRGTAVLGIRADQLGRDIDTAEKLQHHLQLSADPVDMLRVLAKHRPTVLIIDQLDALCDIVDQHTQRLSMLLRLVAEAARSPSIGVVLSCRELEFHHDTRLRSLNAEPLRLGLLSPSDVASALKRENIDPSALGEALLDTLRPPQHLKVFLELTAVKGAPPTYATYQQMLEELWQERVIGRDGDAKRQEAALAVAAYMAEAEEMSAPYAEMSAYALQIEQLVASGVLRQDDPRCISFTHQTWFSFASARAFVTGQIKISEHVAAKGGSLFVRATLWSALHNMREIAPRLYFSELKALWEMPNLRKHLRLLLIEFLGQLREPRDEEAGLLLPVLRKDGYWLPVVLNAISGSRGWFDRIVSRHLPGLMVGPYSRQASWALIKAWPFARARVFELIERFWAHDPAWAENIVTILDHLTEWDERAAKMAIEIIKRGPVVPFPMWDVRLVGKIAETAPAIATRALRAVLDRRLDECRGKADAEGNSPDARSHPSKQLIEDKSYFYGMDKIARAAPDAFLENLWPWFVDCLSDVANPERTSWIAYRDDTVLWRWTWEKSGIDKSLFPAPSPIPTALQAAMEELAKLRPDDFLTFVQQWQSSDLETVHVLIARELGALASIRTSGVIDYLVGDPRRLFLPVTHELLRSLAPHLGPQDMVRLEAAIQKSQRHANDIDETNLRFRFMRQKYDRLHRLNLWRALEASPSLSQAARSLIEQEGRALKGLSEGPTFLGGRIVQSPMSVSQMQKADDEDILNLFAELPDSAEWHPRRWLTGGSSQASWELAELTKSDPWRMYYLVQQFEPHMHELPVAFILSELVQTRDQKIIGLIPDLILSLTRKGFCSSEYKNRAARALRDIAKEIQGLTDIHCTLLKSWLQDSDDSPSQKEDGTNHDEEQTQSVLFDMFGVSPLPNGNFWPISALFAGYLDREPPDHDGILSVLEEHLSRREQSAVWVALLGELRDLPEGERLDALTCRLFDENPAVLRCPEGVRHLANMCWSADGELLRGWLNALRNCSWRWGPQAYGELLMLLALYKPELSWVAEAFERALNHNTLDDDRDLVRLGIAHVAAHSWMVPRHRRTCTDTVSKLLPTATAATIAAIARIFLCIDSFPSDHQTDSMLDAFLAHPAVLVAGPSYHVVQHLNGIVAEDPKRAFQLCVAMLDEAQRTSSKVGPLAIAERDLIRLAMTLQRLHDFREEGLDLFERLLEMDMYKAQEMLRELNVRPEMAISSTQPVE